MSALPSRHRVWPLPVLLATCILTGLLCALFGEREMWKALAWVLLAVPVAVGLWFACLKSHA